MIGSNGENLIFVVSQPRAGSTLLQRMLAGHPSVFATAEPWILLHPLYALRRGGHTAEYNEEWAQAALRDFCGCLEGGEQAYLEAVRGMALSLYNNALRPSGRPCFLDKTPRYYYIASDLRRLFPQAKVIFLLRNPLAVLSSILTSWVQEDWPRLDQYQGDLVQAPSCLDAAIREQGDNAIVLRYEEMVEQPDRVITDLCGRIGLRFDPGMIDYGNHPKPKGNMGDAVGIHRHTRPVTDSREKWVRELAPRRRRVLAEAYLASLNEGMLRRLGYSREELLAALRSEPVEGGLLPSEWVQHAAGFFRIAPLTMAGVVQRMANAGQPEPQPFASLPAGGSPAAATSVPVAPACLPETPLPPAGSTPAIGTAARPARRLRAATRECVEEADEALAAGNLDRAREWMERALDLEPDHLELIAAKAELQTRGEDPVAAAETLRQGIALNPGSAFLQVLLGALCIRLGRVEEFEKAIARALALVPGHPEALRLLAGLNLEQHAFADAGRLYQELVRQAPADVASWLAVGKCAFETQDLAGAAEAFRRVLQLEPEHALARENLQFIEARLTTAPATAPATGSAVEVTAVRKTRGVPSVMESWLDSGKFWTTMQKLYR